MKRKTKIHSVILIFASLIVAFVIVGFDYLRFAAAADETVTLRVNRASVIAEVANARSEWERGLSGRVSLGPHEGMLFVFPLRNEYSFWMKDMLMPIDIIFIDGTRIVDIVENLPAPISQTDIPTYVPRAKANRVLEVPAGWVEKNSVHLNDHVFVTVW